MSEISVYYDGGCHLCSREIDIYKRKDTAHKIAFVDISSPDFNLNTDDVTVDDIHKYFHVKTKNNEWLQGVDAFNKIWEVLNIFKPLQAVAKNNLTRPLMNFGYSLFVKVRPYLPRKKGCETGTCRI
ncbi:MAG: DUF393 domain-containing protein [Bdellovibrionales bacterium]|nr:DUF393 domain-containing protein [Bdellovibrionales bacterium]